MILVTGRRSKFLVVSSVFMSDFFLPFNVRISPYTARRNLIETVFTTEFEAVKNSGSAGKSKLVGTSERIQLGMTTVFRKIARYGMIGRRNR